MKIETQFNIGDTVFVIDRNRKNNEDTLFCKTGTEDQKRNMIFAEALSNNCNIFVWDFLAELVHDFKSVKCKVTKIASWTIDKEVITNYDIEEITFKKDKLTTTTPCLYKTKKEAEEEIKLIKTRACTYYINKINEYQKSIEDFKHKILKELR